MFLFTDPQTKKPQVSISAQAKYNLEHDNTVKDVQLILSAIVKAGGKIRIDDITNYLPEKATPKWTKLNADTLRDILTPDNFQSSIEDSLFRFQRHKEFQENFIVPMYSTLGITPTLKITEAFPQLLNLTDEVKILAVEKDQQDIEIF